MPNSLLIAKKPFTAAVCDFSAADAVGTVQQLPEAGDLDKPKLVFFFDEAPKVLLQKIDRFAGRTRNHSRHARVHLQKKIKKVIVREPYLL